MSRRLSGFEMSQGLRCPGATDCQFWGWCSLKFKRAAPVRPLRGRITTSIFARLYTTDLGPATLKRKNRKEMSSMNVPTNTMRATSPKNEQTAPSKDNNVHEDSGWNKKKHACPGYLGTPWGC